MGRGEAKKRSAVFAVRRKQSEVDFAPTNCPPAAQEKAIAEAKALAEKE